MRFRGRASQLLRTGNLLYTQPAARVSVCVTGIAVGFLLCRLPGGQLRMTKAQARAGWAAAVALGGLAWWAPLAMGLPGYRFNPLHGAAYTAVAPLAWAACIGWVVLATVSGHGGWLGALMEWRWFSVLSRFTYALYLTQFLIFFYNTGRTRTAEYFTLGHLVNFGEISAVLLSALALTFLVDMPAKRLRALWMKPRSKQCKKTDLNGSTHHSHHEVTSPSEDLQQRD